MHVLITGGAGFIGSRLSKKLLDEGFSVCVLDSLEEQIHGSIDTVGRRPIQLDNRVEFVLGSILDSSIVERCLLNADAVVHLAAETGTGQSMYQMARYMSTNAVGTGVLLDTIVRKRPKSLRRLVVASSRAVYGEGEYTCPEHGRVVPQGRAQDALSSGQFEPSCPHCQGGLTQVATKENAKVAPTSLYGISKLAQEQMVISNGHSMGMSNVALRFQNVYGEGQSLSNPYTGILSIFSNRILKHQQINVFEDGLESRDFVHVDDVVEATFRSITANLIEPEIVNVGTGRALSVLEIIRQLQSAYGFEVNYKITGEFRVGDIRHNYADIEKAKRLLGFESKISFSEGLSRFASWVVSQEPTDSAYEKSLVELRERGLLK